MVDRRSKTKEEVYHHESGEKSERVNKEYKPLGQILLEKRIVSPGELDEALRVHWRKGIILGEILKQQGVIREEQLEDVLSFQQAGGK